MNDPNREPDDVPEPDEATADLIAYLDGEVDARKAEAIEARISIDPAARADAEALKRTWELLDHLPRTEPSQSFTARTIDRLEPLKSASASGSVNSKSPSRISTASVPTVSPSRPVAGRTARVLAWTAVCIAAGILGWVVQGPIRASLFPSDEKAHDAQIAADTRLLENLKHYRHVDDLGFLQELDAPELFGDDALGQ